MWQFRSSLMVAAALCIAAFLAGCTQTGPVEFSPTGADAPLTSRADDLDFGPMDHSVSECKSVSHNAGPGACAKVRAYEACMKDRGYITLLGPENPSGCGEPAWEKDVRNLLR
jgi:predicted small lipoprotein YifL